jgi:esterase/lipase superfamily enzyme
VRIPPGISSSFTGRSTATRGSTARWSRSSAVPDARKPSSSSRLQRDVRRRRLSNRANAYDLGFDGAPILYSWPSVGSAVSYATEANNSEWTINHLRWFLEDVAARSGAQYVHLIAHSPGNWPLMKALSVIASEVRATPRPRFRQVMLTAPDVDADVFRTLARSVASVGDRTTLYTSANDEALKLSKRFQGYQRAGDVDPKIVVVDGVDSVDVSAVDASLLGHSYYGDNVSVISDMVRLLTSGLSPDQRCGITSLIEGPSRWWKFIAKSVCPI